MWFNNKENVYILGLAEGVTDCSSTDLLLLTLIICDIDTKRTGLDCVAIDYVLLPLSIALVEDNNNSYIKQKFDASNPLYFDADCLLILYVPSISEPDNMNVTEIDEINDEYVYVGFDDIFTLIIGDANDNKHCVKNRVFTESFNLFCSDNDNELYIDRL